MPSPIPSPPLTERWGLRVLIALGTLALIGMTVMASLGLIYSDIFTKFGAWGDLFGGVLNPILTFVTFIAVLYTIILQRNELALTRNEMKRSADALENQIQQMEKQSKQIDKQNFEATFFQMLQMYNNIIDNIKYESASNPKIGRESLSVKSKDIINLIIYRERKFKEFLIIDNHYKHLYFPDLNPYFRYLYNMLRFCINNDGPTSIYIKLLRSQLSDEEMLVIFYCSLPERGKKMRDLIEKTALFDNLPLDRLARQDHKSFYADSAYDSALAEQLYSTTPN